MDEKQSRETAEAADIEERTEAEAPVPDAPRNRAERRHGAGANLPDNRPVRGNRGGTGGPFQQGGPANKRTHSHRKTG